MDTKLVAAAVVVVGLLLLFLLQAWVMERWTSMYGDERAHKKFKLLKDKAWPSALRDAFSDEQRTAHSREPAPSVRRRSDAVPVEPASNGRKGRVSHALGDNMLQDVERRRAGAADL